MSNKITVLIVDDDKIQRDALAIFLLKNQLVVYTAFDGENALMFLEEMSVDVLILDYFMPGMDGITLMNKLRNMKKIKNTSTIMVSSDEIIVPNCTFIKKTFHANDILENILLNYKKRKEMITSSYNTIKGSLLNL